MVEYYDHKAQSAYLNDTNDMSPVVSEDDLPAHVMSPKKRKCISLVDQEALEKIFIQIQEKQFFE